MCISANIYIYVLVEEGMQKYVSLFSYLCNYLVNDETLKNAIASTISMVVLNESAYYCT